MFDFGLRVADCGLKDSLGFLGARRVHNSVKFASGSWHGRPARGKRGSDLGHRRDGHAASHLFMPRRTRLPRYMSGHWTQGHPQFRFFGSFRVAGGDRWMRTRMNADFADQETEANQGRSASYCDFFPVTCLGFRIAVLDLKDSSLDLKSAIGNPQSRNSKRI